MADELIDTMKNTKSMKGWMAIKLDMSGAFDRIEWNFVIHGLKSLGFSSDWCDLIYQCISTMSTSILLNGSSGEVYFPQRGLRQGDPLSPYLFILCMECFSRSLFTAETNNLIHGCTVTKNSPSVSRLFFADDCLLFSRANINEAKHIAHIIDQFRIFSGQSVNFDKSGLAFSPKDKYLGVPLLLQKNKVESFSPLMDRFSDRLAPWQSKFIAQPGKTTLTQSVLGTIASHHMDVFPMPRKIADKMDAIQRNFWWNKKNGEKGIYGDGSNISIYKDNWISSILGPPKSNFMSANISKVSDLIDAILDDSQVRPPNSDEIEWKALCKTNLLIKIKHFLWKFLHKCLSTRDRLSRFTKHKQVLCPLCNHHNESSQRLFVECNIFIFVLNNIDFNCVKLLQGKDIHSWIKLWFDKDVNLRPNNTNQFNNICFTMWQIWKTRCSVVFENVQVNADVITMSIKNHMSDWLRIHGSSAINRIVNIVVLAPKHWKSPNASDIKVKAMDLGTFSKSFRSRAGGSIDGI
ncbi:uncharacterized protein LOC113295084 [Papaver somniferum]|uniref:uncharacterized protein LOC113295084 n=1 Tax=Papaver somniferum TaxID=3469 RepID=UPI000E6F8392|nr:uncharacterized protein LOC113295084 [Papaver somniferum]